MAARATQARVRRRKLPICQKEDIEISVHPSRLLRRMKIRKGCDAKGCRNMN
jgi:hypothetical protein